MFGGFASQNFGPKPSNFVKKRIFRAKNWDFRAERAKFWNFDSEILGKTPKFLGISFPDLSPLQSLISPLQSPEKPI